MLDQKKYKSVKKTHLNLDFSVPLFLTSDLCDRQCRMSPKNEKETRG